MGNVNVIEELRSKLEEKRRLLEDAESELSTLNYQKDNFQIDPDNYEDSYCDLIDSEGEVEIGSISFERSYILRQLDPIAYRVGLSEYADSMDIEDDETFQELEQDIEGLEEDIESLTSDIDELEEEIEELEEEDEE